MGVPPQKLNDASAVVDPEGSGPRFPFSGCHEPAPRLGAGYIVMADPEDNEFCLD